MRELYNLRGNPSARFYNIGKIVFLTGFIANIINRNALTQETTSGNTACASPSFASICHCCDNNSHSSTKPIIKLKTDRPDKYTNVTFSPSSCFNKTKLAILVAGPTSKKTSTAPGETPASSKPAATGVEATAQIYMGTPTTNIINIAVIPCPH